MKAKMSYITAGKGIPPDSDYAKLFAIPDVLDKSTEHLATFTRSNATAQEIELATYIRNLARASNSGQDGSNQGDANGGRWVSRSTKNGSHGGGNDGDGQTDRHGRLELDSQEPERDPELEDAANALVGVMDDEEDGEGSGSSSESEDEMEEDDDLEDDAEA